MPIWLNIAKRRRLNRSLLLYNIGTYLHSRKRVMIPIRLEVVAAPAHFASINRNCRLQTMRCKTRNRSASKNTMWHTKFHELQMYACFTVCKGLGALSMRAKFVTFSLKAMIKL